MKYWFKFSPNRWALLAALPILFSQNLFAANNLTQKRTQPKGFLYGVGLSFNQEIYKGYEQSTTPLPIIGYKGEKLSVLGPFVTYDAIQFSNVAVSLKAAPRFQGFEQSDSEIFENMDERKTSVDLGFAIKFEKNDWKLNISNMFDVLNRSNGYESKASLSHTLRYGPFFFEPSFTLSYLNRDHVNYYYGVGANETNEFTFEYQGKSAVNTTFGFAFSTPIFFGGFTRLSLNYTQYDSPITNSPLVEKDDSVSALLIFSKFF